MRGKIAIVTGASRGIGKAIALGFAREGATVVVAARSETRAATSGSPAPSTRRSTRSRRSGGQALAVRCDVTDEASVAAMVETALAEFGRIDVLVNNAAVDFPSPVSRHAAQTLGDRAPSGPHRPLPVLPGRAPGDDRAGRRQHRQHQLATPGPSAAPARSATAPCMRPPRPASTASPGPWPPRSGATTSP